MSLANKKHPIKALFGPQRREDILIILIILLIGFASFGLGRLSKIEEMKSPVTIYDPLSTSDTSLGGEVEAAHVQQEGSVVGSKNGSKYHLPWCSGAQRIKEENKVWFATIEEAKEAGYTAAANCKGL